MYYKATRLDATSFADGETRWVVGEVTSLAEDERRTTLCKAGVLHASKEPGESLVGGSWPCRLFEVEPLGKVITSPSHPHKVGAHEWSVIRELPAWMALGPNGEAVADLIERARHLTVDEIRGLDAARVAARDAAWHAAWDAVRVAAWYAAWDAVRVAAWDAAWYAVRVAAWDAAWVAARDVAIALLVRDLITPEQFDMLYGPWASVMEGEK